MMFQIPVLGGNKVVLWILSSLKKNGSMLLSIDNQATWSESNF